ncbi:MAG: XdhC family protein [Candidatus Limiplasma sp.]|nr:XdhC family protein [Candidatus Limiplasma sp.]
MKGLFEALLARLSQGRSVALVSVVQSSGSAPRGPGARMLVDENGWAFGTVGGGKVEHESTLQARELVHKEGFFLRDFALRNREAGDLGMACGGDMRIFFQHIGPDQMDFCRLGLAKIAAGETAYWVTDTQTGAMELTAVEPGEGRYFAQRISGGGRSYVFGGGHVAQVLVPLLAKADFQPVVLEDRAEFADPALFPDASEVRLVDFSRLEGLGVSAGDDVVIITRGHLHDQAVLFQMLKTPAGYVGMIGSRAKRGLVYAYLLENGFSQEDISRVHSPIGLPIQAETPFEIAVSIAAEMIKCRAERKER